MTYKPCPRCKKLIPAGLGYYPTCKPIAEAEWEAAKEHNAKLRVKRYNRGGDNPTEIARFYRSKAWKDTSKSNLQSCGYKCEMGCGRIAREVHHIKPLKTVEGWRTRRSCHVDRHAVRVG